MQRRRAVRKVINLVDDELTSTSRPFFRQRKHRIAVCDSDFVGFTSDLRLWLS